MPTLVLENETVHDQPAIALPAAPVDAEPRVKRRIEAAYVYPTAWVICKRLRPHCRQIEIAGSLRRRAARVGDAEIVIEPKRGDHMQSWQAILAEIDRFIELGTLELDAVVKKNGSQLKRYVLLQCGGIPFELYITDARNFGSILAIRTGPGGSEDQAGFSELLVTQRFKGGFLPNDLCHKGGYVRRRDDVESEAGIVPCSTEPDFFKLLGFAAPPPPESRNAEFAMAMLRVAGVRK